MKSPSRHLDLELSYNITRKYPQATSRISSYILIIATPVLLTIITLFNVATNGYEMQSLYTINPNETEQTRHWFNWEGFTWGGNGLTPKCQNLDVQVGFTFMTTNLGLGYTIQNVTSNDMRQSSFPSLSYHNNNLTDCEVDMIYLNLKKVDESGPGTFDFWSWFNSYANVVAHCNVLTQD